MPNIHVRVDLVGKTERLSDEGKPVSGLPPRPAYASGTISLPISTAARELKLELSPVEKKVSPGEKLKVQVEVRDAKGAPAKNAEVAIIAVDEAIWALSNHEIQNPLATFYDPRGANVSVRKNRPLLRLAKPDAASMGDLGTGEGRAGAGVGDELAAMDAEAPMEEARSMPTSASRGSAKPQRRTRSMANKKSAKMKAEMDDAFEDDDGAPDPGGEVPTIQMRQNFAALGGVCSQRAYRCAWPDNFDDHDARQSYALSFGCVGCPWR